MFAASTEWAKRVSKKTGIDVQALLQATNPEKFNPNQGSPDSGDEILFIGNTRNQFRRIIKDCLDEKLKPSIYGKDWARFVPEGLIKGEFVPNDQIAAKYRSAGVVLNDHWDDMARQGFLSNRLFDAVAAGARVGSDDAVGINDVFGEAVAVYQTPKRLAELCSPGSRDLWGTQEEITTRASAIGEKHSFDERAKFLIATAKNHL